MYNKKKFNHKELFNNEDKVKIFQKVIFILQLETMIAILYFLFAFENKKQIEKYLIKHKYYKFVTLLVYFFIKFLANNKRLLKIPILNWSIYLMKFIVFLCLATTISYIIQIEFFIIICTYLLVCYHFFNITLYMNRDIIIPSIAFFFTNLGIFWISFFLYYFFLNNLKYLILAFISAIILNSLMLNNIMNYIVFDLKKIPKLEESIKEDNEKVTDIKKDYNRKLLNFIKKKKNIIYYDSISWLCSNILFENFKIHHYLSIILGMNQDHSNLDN